MQLVHGLCPDSIPQLLLYDAAQSVMVAQFVGAPHIKLLDGIRQGRTYPQLAQQLANLLLCMMQYTCTQDMPPGAVLAGCCLLRLLPCLAVTLQQFLYCCNSCTADTIPGLYTLQGHASVGFTMTAVTLMKTTM